MDIAGKIRNALGFGQKETNNSGVPPVNGNDFLKYGNRKTMVQDWSNTAMSDVDFYSGYSYAAINNRANKVAQLAASNLKTDALPAILDKAREEDKDVVHPYLTLIDESDDFTNTEFWYDISTYLDLEGVYYLMAVRNVAPNLVGDIQYFKMLNPYEVKRVRNQTTMEIGGYIETHLGMTREIPREMIIEIKKLNPFNQDMNFAMTDAAKEYQFTMKQASDYTRSALKNNLSAPGIITTDVLLEREQFENFQARVMNQEKGIPLFGNGAGAINYEAMQIDMDKAALSDINEISRSTLFAVSGVSKTTMGIEESGTTRDVSKTQKDKFIEDHIMPQLQMIFDALNQDYKKYYKSEWAKNKYTITLENPLGADKEGELADVTIAQTSYDLYMALVDGGYEAEIAAKYASGDITLEELGEPTLEDEMTEAEIEAAAGGNAETDSEDTSASDNQEEDATSNSAKVKTSFLKVKNYNKVHGKGGRFGESTAAPEPKRKKVPKGTNEKRIAEAKKKLYAKKKKDSKEVTGKKKSDSTTDSSSTIDSTTKANKKLEKATSGKAVSKLVDGIRTSTSDYIKANGGDPKAFEKIDEDWVGNDYKTLEGFVKSGKSKELNIVSKLQQDYFAKNKIKEVTVYRGVYGKQAKDIKASIKAGKKVNIKGDQASSFTGYDAVARDYAGGAAFTAPDKISDSVVIKMTFPVKNVVYSTQVAPFHAGNTNDEFIISTPKGYSVDSSNIEVVL